MESSSPVRVSGAQRRIKVAANEYFSERKTRRFKTTTTNLGWSIVTNSGVPWPEIGRFLIVLEEVQCRVLVELGCGDFLYCV